MIYTSSIDQLERDIRCAKIVEDITGYRPPGLWDMQIKLDELRSKQARVVLEELDYLCSIAPETAHVPVKPPEPRLLVPMGNCETLEGDWLRDEETGRLRPNE